MLVADILIAVLVAAVLTAIFVGFAGWRRPGTAADAGLWSAVLFFFLIVFAASWAGGAWVRPVGPAFWGVYWLAFVGMGFVAALLLAAVSTPHRFRRRREGPISADSDLGKAASTTAAFGALFWVLLIMLPLVAVASYAADGTW